MSDTVEVRFVPMSRFPVCLLTPVGDVPLTLTEAEKLVASLVKEIGKTYQEIYKKEMAA